MADIINNNKEFLMEDISFKKTRNIVIILNQEVTKTIKFREVKYLKIIGIDVFTGKVIRIIDTNGAKFGLYTYNEKISKISINIVIQASFNNYNSDKYLNLLRITSDFRKLGESNIGKLYKKYNYVIKNYEVEHIYNFVKSFNDIKVFNNVNRNKDYNIVVRFNGSKVKEYQGKRGSKYQLNMKYEFIDICDHDYNIRNKKEKYFKGLALISITTKPEKSKRIFKIEKLINGRFLDNEEYKLEKEEKEKRNKMEEEHNLELAMKWEKEMKEQEKFYDEELYYEEICLEDYNEEEFYWGFSDIDDSYFENLVEEYKTDYQDEIIK